MFNHGYALLIGVGECEETRLSLPVTVKDTQAMYAALIDGELCDYSQENIQILNNKEATKVNILQGLNWLQEKADHDLEATIFIYYSGHGGVGTDGSYYLIPHDYDSLEDEPLTTAISAEELTKALRKINAQRLLVVIDSCHAAGMTTSKYEETAKTERKLDKTLSGLKRVAPSKDLRDCLKQGKGRVVFTSSEGEQYSWIKDDSISVYTFHFLEALQGAGNQSGDTEVMVSNIMNYVSQTVPETVHNLYNEKQVPHFDFDTNDFAIAKLLGGKGLPNKGWDEVKSEAQEKIEQITVGRDSQKVDASGSNNTQYITQSVNINIKQ